MAAAGKGLHPPLAPLGEAPAPQGELVPQRRAVAEGQRGRRGLPAQRSVCTGAPPNPVAA